MGLLSNKIRREQLKPGDHIYSWRHAYIYAHHGIYIGEGKVIHFTRGSTSQAIDTGNDLFDRIMLNTSTISTHNSPNSNPCPVCGHQRGLSGIVSTCLDCFLHGGELYLFEYGVGAAFFVAKARGGTCSLASADPAEEVLHRASYLFDKGDFGVYDLFENNCEDFAVYCKTELLVEFTGVGTGQAATLLMLASSAAVASPFQLLTVSVTGLAALGFGVVYCVSRLVSDIGVRCDVARVPVEMLVPRLNPSLPQREK